MGLIKQCYLGYICWATRSISFEPWLGQSEERKRKKQSLTLSSSSASSSPHSGSSLNMLLNLLGWHWLIKLHWFQVYNSIVRYLYTILSVYSIPCVRHPESSLVSLPCIPLYPLPPPPTLRLTPGITTPLFWVPEFLAFSFLSCPVITGLCLRGHRGRLNVIWGLCSGEMIITKLKNLIWLWVFSSPPHSQCGGGKSDGHKTEKWQQCGDWLREWAVGWAEEDEGGKIEITVTE